MSNMNIIRKYCRNFKMELSYSGNRNDRINFMERCAGGNLLEILLPKGEDEFAAEQPYCWTLLIEVMVKRAKYDYEESWRWEPGDVTHGKIAFHHWDHEELLKRVAEWLTEHEDHKTGLVKTWGSSKERDVMLHSIKCGPIGNL